MRPPAGRLCEDDLASLVRIHEVGFRAGVNVSRYDTFSPAERDSLLSSSLCSHRMPASLRLPQIHCSSRKLMTARDSDRR